MVLGLNPINLIAVVILFGNVKGKGNGKGNDLQTDSHSFFIEFKNLMMQTSMPKVVNAASQLEYLQPIHLNTNMNS